jgi:hypothetical protein
MPVSPADFALWARVTGNKYPETAEEKIAAAPHAYNFAKNFGKAGSSAPNERVGGSIMYKQPVAVQNSAPNSLFNSPVTPDNRASKIAGTLDSSLTSEHFQNQEEEEMIDRREQQSLLSRVGKVALGAGAVAAGAALAASPSGQQALRTAGTYVQENAKNVGDRVSSFLRGAGGGNYPDPDVIRNSGDVTTPTTAENYNQRDIPNVTQDAQFAKGSYTGSLADSTVPTTTESYSVKPVTESERITTSQTFSPRQKEYEGGSAALQNLEQRYAPSDEVRAARVNAATQALIAAGRTNREPYQMEIPGVNPTLMALRSPLSHVDLNDPSLGIYKESTETPIGPSTHQYSVFDQQPASVSEQTSALVPTGVSQSYHYDKPMFTTRTGPGQQTIHSVVPRPKYGANVTSKIMGGGGGGYTDNPYAIVGTAYADPFDEATPNRASQDWPGAPKVTRLPSMLSTGETYQDKPGVLISPGRNVPNENTSDLLDRQSRLSTGLQAIEGIRKGLETGSSASVKSRTNTFLNQINDLYNLSQDPGVIESGSQMAMPLKLTLPGGEVIPTRSLYTPFGAVEAMPGYVAPNNRVGEVGIGLTQSQHLESQLIEHGQRLDAAKAEAYNVLGVDLSNSKAGYPDLSEEQYYALPPSTQERLADAHVKLADTKSKLSVARDFPLRYTINKEVAVGHKWAPVINESTGEITDMKLVPEEKTLNPIDYYNMRSQGSVGRQEVGGVGRRRDSLASEHGYSLNPTSRMVAGSLSDVSPVLYQVEHPETGEMMTVPADSVSLSDIALGTARPIAGTSVEPSRILGQSDRPYKGISANVISKESFDPVLRTALLKAFPKRETPEGLVYAEGAMERPAGGTNPAAGTRFFTPRPAPAGSPRALEREQYKQEISEIASGARAPGALAPPMYQGRKTEDLLGLKGGQVITRQPTAAESAFRNEALLKAAVEKVSSANQPMESEEPEWRMPHIKHSPQIEQTTQMTIPGTNLSPLVRQSQADVEASALANYMAQRAPGRSLGSQLQRAMANASVRQPDLF